MTRCEDCGVSPAAGRDGDAPLCVDCLPGAADPRPVAPDRSDYGVPAWAVRGARVRLRRNPRVKATIFAVDAACYVRRHGYVIGSLYRGQIGVEVLTDTGVAQEWPLNQLQPAGGAA